VVLEAATLSASDLSNADIAGTVQHLSVALPSDFGELQAITVAESILQTVHVITKDALLLMRSRDIHASQIDFWVALSYRAATAGTGAPVPILELYPAPSADNAEGLEIAYRAGWRRISTDSDLIDVPQFAEPLLKAVVRAFALGYEEDDRMPMHHQLAMLEQSALYLNTRRFDASIGPAMGPIRNGAAQTASEMSWPERSLLTSTVQLP
jgi:hypothetical protein